MRVADLDDALVVQPFRAARSQWAGLKACTTSDPLIRIAQMGSALAASNVARGGINFVTSLVIARRLGPAGFGMWTVSIAAASALTAAFDLGFGVLLTREAARSDGQVGRLLADALTARLALFLPVGVLAYSGLLTNWIGVVSPDTLHAAVLLAAVGLTYGSIASVCRTLPRPLLSILTIETGGALFQCGAAAILLTRGGGIAALLYLSAVVLAGQCVLAYGVWRGIAPIDRLAPPSPRSAASALRRAVPFALTGIVANAQARLGPLLLGLLTGAGEAASFGVASRLEGMARRLPSSAFGAALPVFSHEARRGEVAPVRARFAGALRWFAVAAAAVLVMAAGPLVRLTYGAQFAAAATPLLLAGLGLMPSLVNGGRKVYLYSTGREHLVLRWTAASLAIQTVACLLLIPRFGAAGAMGGLALGEAAIWFPLRRAEVGNAKSSRLPSRSSLDGRRAKAGPLRST